MLFLPLLTENLWKETKIPFQGLFEIFSQMIRIFLERLHQNFWEKLFLKRKVHNKFQMI